jgi:hypothetical protein
MNILYTTIYYFLIDNQKKKTNNFIVLLLEQELNCSELQIPYFLLNFFFI